MAFKWHSVLQVFVFQVFTDGGESELVPTEPGQIYPATKCPLYPDVSDLYKTNKPTKI